jgi:hypothetical protein
MGTHLTSRFRVAFVAISAALALAACEGTTAPGAPVQIGGVIGSDSVAPDIQGTWRQVVRYIDEYGFVNTVTTTWNFDPFGNAVRTMVTASVTLNVADTAVTTGVWRFDGPLVVVNFLQPSPGQLRLDVLVQGNVMTLGGQEYIRVE